jgi:molecular chaperone GrpE
MKSEKHTVISMDKQKENRANEDTNDSNLTKDEELQQETETEIAETSNENDEALPKTGLFGRKEKKIKQSTNDTLKEESAKLKAENAELQDKFLRLYSEFDNYRKRTQKEKLDMIQNAAESLINNLLSVIDDMERALKYSENPNANLDSTREGQALILQKLNNLLKQKGLSAIDTKEARFDTDYHEAISIIAAPTEEDKGKIVEEVEKGYTLNDKVIRFSKVVIYQ